MSKFIVEKVGTRASKRRRLDVPLPTPPKQPVHLPSETMIDAALFLGRLDLDSVQFSSQRHRTFVRDNAHLIPLRDLAGISFEHNPAEGRVRVVLQPVLPTPPPVGTVQGIEFNGTWEEVLGEKEQFQNAVRYSVPRRLRLATPNMEWHAVNELFGDTPLTIRVSSEVLISESVQPDIVGIQGFLRPFALVNCLKIAEVGWHPHYRYAPVKCNDGFLRWCTENSITQLVLGEYVAVLSDEAVLDFCFGPHGTDTEPRHLTARFQCNGDFMARLLEANRKCNRTRSITMGLTARMPDAPSIAALAPYITAETRRRGLDVTTFELPDEFEVKIDYSCHPMDQWSIDGTCRIEFSRPAQPSQ